MPLLRSSAMRWSVFFVCIILGTWAGIFLQRFAPTSTFFANFINFTFDVRQIDLVVLRLGLFLGLKINLGTVLGGLLGLLLAR